MAISQQKQTRTVSVIPNNSGTPFSDSSVDESARRSFAGAEWPVLDAPFLQLVDIDSLDVPVDRANA